MTVLENLRKEYPYLYETHLHTSEPALVPVQPEKKWRRPAKTRGIPALS